MYGRRAVKTYGVGAGEQLAVFPGTDTDIDCRMEETRYKTGT